jgi:hypothetical protein
MTLSGFKEFYFRQAIFLNGIQGGARQIARNGNHRSYFSHF